MGVGNLWDGVVRADRLTMDVPALGFAVRLARAASPGPAVLAVRAERMTLAASSGANQVAGTPERTIYAGETVTHAIRLANGTTVLVRTRTRARLGVSRLGASWAGLSRGARSPRARSRRHGHFVVSACRLPLCCPHDPSRASALAFSWTWSLLFSIAPLCIILVICAGAAGAKRCRRSGFATDPGNFASALN